VKKIAIRQGDLYLLCSDGLTDLLHESEITDILCAGYSAVDCVDKLIQAAMEHGGRDNITVMIYRID
jgi:protein phosphatase